MKLKNAHGGYAGRSLIERIQAQLDRQNKRLSAIDKDSIDYAIVLGRTEGMAATLAILRSSSLPEELTLSQERINK
ncbi:MAG TPA: hypothetical protein PL071_09075 [Nitrosomonas sp.]|nr:hypothetical protein [Nitrosomonas sp.]